MKISCVRQRSIFQKRDAAYGEQKRGQWVRDLNFYTVVWIKNVACCVIRHIKLLKT